MKRFLIICCLVMSVGLVACSDERSVEHVEEEVESMPWTMGEHAIIHAGAQLVEMRDGRSYRARDQQRWLERDLTDWTRHRTFETEPFDLSDAVNRLEPYVSERYSFAVVIEAMEEVPYDGETITVIRGRDMHAPYGYVIFYYGSLPSRFGRGDLIDAQGLINGVFNEKYGQEEGVIVVTANAIRSI
ncbi:hypothetical protein GOP80_08030 [Planococcaceae bacterium Storch 2/2-2]|nr:hypothetical protein [Planococcaceae bacterium Storch 2/2-2]